MFLSVGLGLYLIVCAYKLRYGAALETWGSNGA